MKRENVKRGSFLTVAKINEKLAYFRMIARGFFTKKVPLADVEELLKSLIRDSKGGEGK